MRERKKGKGELVHYHYYTIETAATSNLIQLRTAENPLTPPPPPVLARLRFTTPLALCLTRWLRPGSSIDGGIAASEGAVSGPAPLVGILEVEARGCLRADFGRGGGRDNALREAISALSSLIWH
jgi:hypothetical protein